MWSYSCPENSSHTKPDKNTVKKWPVSSASLLLSSTLLVFSIKWPQLTVFSPAPSSMSLDTSCWTWANYKTVKRMARGEAWIRADLNECESRSRGITLLFSVCFSGRLLFPFFQGWGGYAAWLQSISCLLKWNSRGLVMDWYLCGLVWPLTWSCRAFQGLFQENQCHSFETEKNKELVELPLTLFVKQIYQKMHYTYSKLNGWNINDEPMISRQLPVIN